MYHGPKRNCKPEELLKADVVRALQTNEGQFPLGSFLCSKHASETDLECPMGPQRSRDSESADSETCKSEVCAMMIP